GGYGYIKEYPVEQYLRDNKIASIYEGTNGIQALDLVGRKMTRNPGAFQAYIGMIAETSAKNADNPVLKKELEMLASARDGLLGAAMYFMEVGQKDHMVPLSNATPFLELMGEVTVGWLLLEQAAIAHPKLLEVCKAAGVDPDDAEALGKLCQDNVDANFYDGKVKVAKFWANHVLAVCAAEAEVIKSGDRTVLDVSL
ncbi:MAG: acyl-CoA dehydrogenase, partial [Deltaproteobacteria bacterium]|nr:acyl-CoA dehydrogenase [Deltaproteobacteria bacterium]